MMSFIAELLKNEVKKEWWRKMKQFKLRLNRFKKKKHNKKKTAAFPGVSVKENALYFS